MTELVHLKQWLQLSNDTKLNVYTETGRKVGLPPFAIEKDWWLVQTLTLVFSMECASAICK